VYICAYLRILASNTSVVMARSRSSANLAAVLEATLTPIDDEEVVIAGPLE
jgi:hypothetical protein